VKVARRILKERILASGTIDPEAFQLRNGEDGVSLVCLELPCTKKRIQWVESKIKGEWRCYTADEIRRFGIEVEQGKKLPRVGILWLEVHTDSTIGCQ